MCFQHILENRDAVLNQPRLQNLELVLLTHECLPSCCLEWLHDELETLDLKLDRLRRQSVPGHPHEQPFDSAEHQLDGEVVVAK